MKYNVFSTFLCQPRQKNDPHVDGSEDEDEDEDNSSEDADEEDYDDSAARAMHVLYYCTCTRELCP